jgi:arylformamidase
LSRLKPKTLDYIDISPEVSERSAVFPGDAPYRRKVALDFSKGDHLGLSSIETTVHVGAHADAPSHYDAKGQGIGARRLDYYLGSCQVIGVEAAAGARLTPQDVATAVEAPRVLFKTGSWPDPDRWTTSFNSLSPELIFWLADRGVVLVGIDTPSIDPHDSKALESHKAVFSRDMAVLEGLTLQDAAAGLYELVALPLRLKDADASPVRAVLIKP